MTIELMGSNEPSAPMRYDEAPPPGPASETKSVFRLSTAKPNGVGPADEWTSGPVMRPPVPTVYVSIRFIAFSVTITTLPSSLKPTCAGPAESALSGRAEPAIGATLVDEDGVAIGRVGQGVDGTRRAARGGGTRHKRQYDERRRTERQRQAMECPADHGAPPVDVGECSGIAETGRILLR